MKVNRKSGFEVIRRVGGATFLPAFVAVEGDEDAPAAVVPEVEGETNGDEPVVKLRGAYTEGTATMILSRSKKIMSAHKP